MYAWVTKALETVYQGRHLLWAARKQLVALAFLVAVFGAWLVYHLIAARPPTAPVFNVLTDGNKGIVTFGQTGDNTLNQFIDDPDAWQPLTEGQIEELKGLLSQIKTRKPVAILCNVSIGAGCGQLARRLASIFGAVGWPAAVDGFVLDRPPYASGAIPQHGLIIMPKSDETASLKEALETPMQTQVVLSPFIQERHPDIILVLVQNK
jgi:hypothetical protein